MFVKSGRYLLDIFFEINFFGYAVKILKKLVGCNNQISRQCRSSDVEGGFFYYCLNGQIEFLKNESINES